MKRIARKSSYVLLMIFVITAMMLVMAGPLYADAYDYSPSTKSINVTLGVESTFSLEITGTPGTSVTGINVVGQGSPKAKDTWITATPQPLVLDGNGKGTLTIKVLADTVGNGFGAKIKAVGDDGQAAGCDLTINVVGRTGGPGIYLTKTADPTSIPLGVESTITYTYTVANTGNINLVGVYVVDNNHYIGKINFGDLEVGKTSTRTATYTVTPTDLDDIVNIAVAEGFFIFDEESASISDISTGPELLPIEPAIDTATVTVIPPGAGVFNLWATTEGPGSITNPGLFVISAGQSLNYTMTPDGGASIVDVLVNGVSVGTGSSYTFVNVNSNQTIHVIFSGGGGGIAVAGLTEGTIEVLAFTGNNTLFYFIGFALMAIGIAFGSFFISKNLKKR